MNKIKYYIQYIGIIILFFIYRLLGLKISSKLSGYILLIIGPLFRSNKLTEKNLIRAIPNLTEKQRKKIIKNMWLNYGKILSEYMFIKNFRNSVNFSNKIKVENQKVLEKIILENQPVIFISGHFNNFELMAMQIEKMGVELAAVYRPLNNNFLNPIMENIRRKYICKNQIKKGISGTKLLLQQFKKKTSIAIMIDQRVSEGIRCNFFNQGAFTTTIPAQFVKKFKTKIVPVYIERIKENNFKLKFHDPIEFKEEDTLESITQYLNLVLEKMILQNPDQWIWSHNRWK
jgi:Kdo2-lipid IVA lauroyltransferase/acyltransferase